jgi:hypothetical protein
MSKTYENIAILIRTWNNNKIGTLASVNRALCNGIRHIIVVVRCSVNGNVKEWLASLVKANPDRITILEITEGSTWANDLNRGLAHVRHFNRFATVNGEVPIDFVLPCSNEVLWASEQLDVMLARINASRQIGVVGTSFQGYADGNEVKLGMSYWHPRNTFMLIRWEAFLEVGHFDSICDGFGGMEDLYFLLEMVTFANYRWANLDLQIKLLVDVNKDQGDKERTEQAAMRKIVNRFKDDVANSSQVFKDRIYNTLKAFGLNQV